MIRLDDLLAATGGRLVGAAGAATFSGFAFDSRRVRPGELFLAVVTDTGDGHAFCGQAIAAGAAGVLCQRLPDVESALTAPHILVDNTQQALLDYARYVLNKRGVEVVGVTGSVGKTSTKEAVAQVLGDLQPVFRNHGNFSGRFGLPIALGQLEEGTRLAVLEMASDAYDEIRDLAQVTQPRMGIVTGVSHSHVAYFGSLEGIAREKAQLIKALPRDGVAILNRDDPLVWAMREETPARVVSYGLCARAEVWGEAIRVTPQGTELDIHGGGRSIRALIPYVGAHHAYTALAATAAGLTYDLSLEQIAERLRGLEPIAGRTRLIEAIHGATLLDDAYNASPKSALAALDTLAALPAQRRLVLLGDMTELGDWTESGHRQVGQRIAQVADWFLAKGELAAMAARAALDAGMAEERVQVVYAADDAVHALGAELRRGDLLLLKGSAAARLEQVAVEFLAHPEQADRLLPRQDAGWSQVRLQRPGRPTWVDIDLGAIAGNVRQIKELVGPEVAVLAVLKADGYGHGAAKVARTVLNNGASWLGVACLGEAIELRQAGIQAPILSLGLTPPWQAREAVLHDVATTVFSLETAQALSRASQDLRRPARVHIKVDTGMGRLGVMPDDAVSFVSAVASLPELTVEGLFTHFANADAADLAYTYGQIAQFDGVIDALRERGLLPSIVHAANSAAILRLPETHYDMVRLGIAMYGLDPSPDCLCPRGFRAALSFKCQVAQVKALPPGSAIGYGCTYRTTRPSQIAVIPVGYADGFRRGPRHWGSVLVHGRPAPIVGRVCMDQTMIDVTDIPGVQPGDEVVLIGSQGEAQITVDDVAERLGTINYEVVSEILARVPRLV